MSDCDWPPYWPLVVLDGERLLPWIAAPDLIYCRDPSFHQSRCTVAAKHSAHCGHAPGLCQDEAEPVSISANCPTANCPTADSSGCQSKPCVDFDAEYERIGRKAIESGFPIRPGILLRPSTEVSPLGLWPSYRVIRSGQAMTARPYLMPVLAEDKRVAVAKADCKLHEVRRNVSTVSEAWLSDDYWPDFRDLTTRALLVADAVTSSCLRSTLTDLYKLEGADPKS